jgi:hypothetical protein
MNVGMKRDTLEIVSAESLECELDGACVSGWFTPRDVWPSIAYLAGQPGGRNLLANRLRTCRSSTQVRQAILRPKGIDHFEERELIEIGVAGANSPDAMFAHKNGRAPRGVDCRQGAGRRRGHRYFCELHAS